VCHGRATLRELEEYYSLEDAYNILETMHVEAHNARVMSEKRQP
jgi:hypothetical protein